jgi:hypothetical protein
MGHGYVLGPLILLPLLGALFVIPRPDDDRPPRFTWARASVLECHVQAGYFFAFTPNDPAALLPSEGAEPAAQDLR